MADLSEFFEKLQQDYADSDAVYFLGFDTSYDNRIFSVRKLPQFSSDIEQGLSRFGGPHRTPNYQEAYLLAAEELLATAKSKNLLDELGVVIMYCARHYVELALKTLLKHCHDLRKEFFHLHQNTTEIRKLTQCEIESTTTHDIVRLIKYLKEQIKHINNTDTAINAQIAKNAGKELKSPTAIGLPDAFLNLCEEIGEHDPSGELFRYDHRHSNEQIDEAYYKEIETRHGYKPRPIKIQVKNPNFPKSKCFDLVRIVTQLRIHNDSIFYGNGDPREADGFEAMLVCWIYHLSNRCAFEQCEEERLIERQKAKEQYIIKALKNQKLTMKDQLKLAEILEEMWGN